MDHLMMLLVPLGLGFLLLGAVFGVCCWWAWAAEKLDGLKPGQWVPCFRCSACKELLNREQLLRRYGVCPHCGFSCPGTVCGHIKSSRRWTGKEWEEKA